MHSESRKFEAGNTGNKNRQQTEACQKLGIFSNLFLAICFPLINVIDKPWKSHWFLWRCEWRESDKSCTVCVFVYCPLQWTKPNEIGTKAKHMATIPVAMHVNSSDTSTVVGNQFMHTLTTMKWKCRQWNMLHSVVVIVVGAGAGVVVGRSLLYLLCHRTLNKFFFLSVHNGQGSVFWFIRYLC